MHSLSRHSSYVVSNKDGKLCLLGLGTCTEEWKPLHDCGFKVYWAPDMWHPISPSLNTLELNCLFTQLFSFLPETPAQWPHCLYIMASAPIVPKGHALQEVIRLSPSQAQVPLMDIQSAEICSLKIKMKMAINRPDGGPPAASGFQLAWDYCLNLPSLSDTWPHWENLSPVTFERIILWECV